MKVLNPQLNYEKFLNDLILSKHKALLLDYDGTLAPFQEDPTKAFPYEGVREILNKINNDSHTRMVIISGRWTKDLIPLLKLDKQPEIWGTHGIERLKSDGSYEVETIQEENLRGLTEADHWLSTVGNVRYEQKPGSIAVHWRGLDRRNIKKIKSIVEPRFRNYTIRYGLIFAEFDGGYELRVPGRKKGDAVQTILSEMPKKTISAYLGDDLTDEDAFKAIKGKGIGVLVREELRPTIADLWIQPPQELLYFLLKWYL